MNKTSNKYKDDSIISLDPREFTRLRPSTYLGDNSSSTQLVREVFANSLDEHNIGHGNVITVNIDTKKNEYVVEDNGQGFPINVLRDDGKTVLEASFSVLNTSGKYDDKNGVYGGVSLGLNGIGSKLTNFLSKTLDVLSFNDKGFEHIWFKDGLFIKRETGEWKKGTSGTIVKWKPDPQFFQDVNANNHDLKSMFEAISALCPTLTINYKYDKEEKVYHSENGLQDLIDKKVKDKELFTNRFSIRKIAENNLFDIVLTYTSDYSDNITAYVNYGLTESGIHISTVRTLITKQINKYAADNGLLKKNDDAFSGPELSEGLVIVFNIKATNVKYDSQTKVRVVDIDKTLINAVLSNDFADWLTNNPKEAKIIIDRALNARRAKEAAQKAKDGVRNATTKGKKFINLPTKLVDAYSKDRKECELYLCLKGDTKIKLLDGTTPTIESLVGQSGLWCYSSNEYGSMIPTRIKKVFKTQEVSKLLKLTFDDGSSVECTPEHKFLDKETLTWVEAKDLSIDQSLCSMKFKTIDGYDFVYVSHGQDYSIKQKTKGKYFHGLWEPVHIRTARVLGLAHEYDGNTIYDIHHLDHNKQNNTPDNLLVCTKSEHAHIHNMENYESGEFQRRLDNMSAESRLRMQQGVYSRTTEGIQHQKDAVSQAWKDGKYANATFANFNNSEKRKVNGKDYTYKCKILKYAKSLLDRGFEITEDIWEEYRCKQRSKADARFIKALSYFDSVEQLVTEAKNYNLAIVSIEEVNYQLPISVYCLDVENEFHSFVLDNGLISHNCEGDSAGNGLVAKRDGKTQAIFPLRGKILSCRKASMDKVYANQEIANIVKALGLDVDKATGKLIYDVKKLRYGKIIIATDADPDGYDIRLLLINAFWWLCPDLVLNGHIYAAIPPLYRITTKKNEYIYLTEDKDLDEYKKKHSKESFLINRNKGLGEQDASELAYCLLKPETRNVKQIIAADFDSVDNLLEIFMGDKVPPRREFLLEHYNEVSVDVE